MKTRRRNGRVLITIFPNRYKTEITRDYSEEKDELFNVFSYGKYLIMINQSKPIRLCQIPDLKHEDVLLLSLEEARPLLRYFNMSDSGFYGKIIYQHGKAGNFAPIIIIDFDRIIKSIKRKGIRSIKREILRIFSHEIRHAEQHQKHLFPLKGFWKFTEHCQNIWQRLSKKSRFLISCVIFGAIGLSVSLLLQYPFPLFLITMSFLTMLFLVKVLNPDQRSEEDADNFSQKSIQDKRWRECVKVKKVPQ